MWSIIFIILAILLVIIGSIPEKIMMPFAQADGAYWRIHYTRIVALLGAFALLILVVISFFN